MSKKIPPAGHRIIAQDTPEATARRKKTRAAVDAEKDELIAEGRKMMAPIIAQRKQFSAIVKDLRSERERQGLSLSDVADRTGMDRTFISRLETSPSPNPTVSTLHRYAECLGVDFQIALVQR